MARDIFVYIVPSAFLFEAVSVLGPRRRRILVAGRAVAKVSVVERADELPNGACPRKALRMTVSGVLRLEGCEAAKGPCIRSRGGLGQPRHDITWNQASSLPQET
ncbi:hypothetical protein ACJQWK_03147 [Exserohilum turcicum]